MLAREFVRQMNSGPGPYRLLNACWRKLQTSHDDLVVIFLTITKYDFKRVLIDNGSSTDILFYDAFQRMRLSPRKL